MKKGLSKNQKIFLGVLLVVVILIISIFPNQVKNLFNIETESNDLEGELAMSSGSDSDSVSDSLSDGSSDCSDYSDSLQDCFTEAGNNHDWINPTLSELDCCVCCGTDLKNCCLKRNAHKSAKKRNKICLGEVSDCKKACSTKFPGTLACD